MIKKTREIIKKLELGLLEFLVGLLMFVGLIGYFYHVPADVEWLDHTISFFIFSALFYHLGITSILFGHKNKKIDLLIIISFFVLFFKDVIAYTEAAAYKFVAIKFVDYFYIFFRNNPEISVLLTFYLGILGLIIASICIAGKFDTGQRSFLAAIKQKPFRSKALKFLSILTLLLWFYFFVYNAILEWLEFTLDDPIIFIGILFFITKISKHRVKFHKDDFVFRIGEFSENLYSRFVRILHYKHTVPLAISGLIILHALTDIGVFVFSLTTGKENIYIDKLGSEHISFYGRYLEDLSLLQNGAAFAKLSLIINYVLNTLSFITLLIIPVAAWFRIFYQKELHFRRIYLPLIYSSLAAFFLLPAYSIRQIKEAGIAGIDIVSNSLMKSPSILSMLIQDQASVVILVAVLSLAVGIIVYFLSGNKRAKRELYALSILIGVLFYAKYIYLFCLSLAEYLYSSIIFLIKTPHIFIAAILAIILLISIVFYVGGYLMFVYELIMEYHRRKWSDPIDEELVRAVSKIRKAEKKVAKIVRHDG